MAAELPAPLQPPPPGSLPPSPFRPTFFSSAERLQLCSQSPLASAEDSPALLAGLPSAKPRASLAPATGLDGEGAGSWWVRVVALAVPSCSHPRRQRRWSGASPSRGGLEGDAFAVSSAATKLPRVGNPFVASVAVVRVTGSVTVIVVIDL
jgi:hypothetical protein